MSSVVNATFKTGPSPWGPPAPSGLVPEKKQHLRRSAFVYLIDISGSTGRSADQDIHHINDTVSQLATTLRSPPGGSELALNIDTTDHCFITYSDRPETVVDWSLNTELPASIQPFKPQGGTRQAAALEYALARIGERLNYYKANNMRYGLPHIIHLTNGAPTDMGPGSQRWMDIQAKLGKLSGAEKQRAAILHFVSPNGCTDHEDFRVSGEHGQVMSGLEAMIRLSGQPYVFEMKQGVAAFEALVKMITVVITLITENFGTAEAAGLAVHGASGHIRPTTNYV